MLDSPTADTHSDRIEQLNTALESGMFVHVRRLLNELPAADVAHWFESTPPTARALLWRMLDEEHQGEVVQFLNEEVRNSFLGEMDAERLAAISANLEIDDLADIFGALPDNVMQEVLEVMDEQDRHRLQTALSYPEDTAGGLMNLDTVTVRPDVTVDVVLRYLRMKGELPESTDRLYVVDKDDNLIGAVALSTLVTSKAQLTVSEIKDPEYDRIEVDTPAVEVAHLFERRDLISAPVVDPEGKLLGRITIDDVVDVIREEAEHSLMSMAGLDEADDTFAPVWSTARRRALWLGINLITVIVAAMVIGLFEKTIAIVTALAILLPIVPSMGGIAGTQSLTLVIRGLALGRIAERNISYLLNKELMVSIINGVLWALTVGSVVWLYFSNTPSAPYAFHMAVALSGAMVINLVVGVLTGASLPLIMRRLNMDPALSGGVVLTTVTDVVGNLSMLGLATLFFA